jgi:hypothetical protein
MHTQYLLLSHTHTLEHVPELDQELQAQNQLKHELHTHMFTPTHPHAHTHIHTHTHTPEYVSELEQELQAQHKLGHGLQLCSLLLSNLHINLAHEWDSHLLLRLLFRRGLLFRCVLCDGNVQGHDADMMLILMIRC